MASRISSAAMAAARTSLFRSPALGVSRRTLSTSTLLRHKETSSHASHEVEKHKDDSLSKQKEGQGHWKPELASDSEESVKADRHGGPHEKTEDNVRDLQQRTKDAAEETHRAGTSMRDGL